ncbi:thiolase family protein [Nigerium massiliense]|uniref:thiolase family protein n=1 Tax=Nigerium massiliense TaxID=1522317 RepID=UPI000A5363A5|nr:thiolase family protein [Nigerium massiliense]
MIGPRPDHGTARSRRADERRLRQPDPGLAPVIVAARRTPFGTAGKAFAEVELIDLVAPVLRALVADLPGAPPVDDVVLGNTRGPGGNPARVAALSAGLGLEVPGVTVDRQCGSGQEAIHVAAAQVASGRALLVLAGGGESASTQPIRLWPGRHGAEPVPFDRGPFAPAEIGDPDMGPAAENVAREVGISRERQDAYAVRSHARTLAARDAGVFDAEIVPIGGVRVDERPRLLSERVLSRFPPAFEPGGTVTAGNSCGVSDGAALVAVVPEWLRAELGLPGLRIVDWTATALHPTLPGLGPVSAVTRVLERAGRPLTSVDVLEVTEAFAAQVLGCTDRLGVAVEPSGAGPVVCPDGGALALGHPWGASAAALLVRLFDRLVRRGLGTVGVATCGIGGGQGLATLVEVVRPG